MGRKAIKCKHNVELKLEEHILDAYEKIMQLYHEGRIELQLWENYTPEQRQETINGILKTFAPVMQDFYEKYPEEYELLTTVRPELKLKNKMEQ